ncbi:MAG: Na+/H+ antiporter NhaA, partial [Planctomycetales bacterium]
MKQAKSAGPADCLQAVELVGQPNYHGQPNYRDVMAKQAQPPEHLPRLPEKPIDRFVEPVKRFMRVEAASGVVLLICTVIAMVAANSPWSEAFLHFWKTPVDLVIGEAPPNPHYLQHWINDGLMVIFFFVIGLEVKREIVLGELRDLRQAVLPMVAALGGMIVPAGVYLSLQFGQTGQDGWGIPMATDIAFVVGCLAVLGSRVPHGFRILLLSLAIVDDIGAILVIAVGYTENLNLIALGLGILGLGGVFLLNKVGVRNIGVYCVCGALIWLAFHESGVHATIAGVLLGLMTPATSWISK